MKTNGKCLRFWTPGNAETVSSTSSVGLVTKTILRNIPGSPYRISNMLSTSSAISINYFLGNLAPASLPSRHFALPFDQLTISYVISEIFVLYTINPRQLCRFAYCFTTFLSFLTYFNINFISAYCLISPLIFHSFLDDFNVFFKYYIQTLTMYLEKPSFHFPLLHLIKTE